MIVCFRAVALRLHHWADLEAGTELRGERGATGDLLAQTPLGNHVAQKRTFPILKAFLRYVGPFGIEPRNHGRGFKSLFIVNEK